MARTGAIGLIAVTGTEKFKGGLRVTFVCGGRALARCGCCATRWPARVRALSVLPAELPAAIRRLQAEGKRLRKRASELQVALAVHEAERLLALAARNEAAAIVATCSTAGTLPGCAQSPRALIARGPMQVVLATSEAAGLDRRGAVVGHRRSMPPWRGARG